MEIYGINDVKHTQLWTNIQNAIHNVSLEDGVVEKDSDKKMRECKIGWISDKTLMKELYYKICEYNEKYSAWNFDIRGLENLQYTLYNNYGSHYDWHQDPLINPKDCTFNNFDSSLLIRKISFTIFLNDPDEYEGGELDLEWRSPSTTTERYDSFKAPAGSILVFPSTTWHRVRPVTSGIRKSLVGWVLGPPFR
tara:strand:- start:67 stop:648 length:582 start_codon:yes stop_codon:yes gene_type:complete